MASARRARKGGGGGGADSLAFIVRCCFHSTPPIWSLEPAKKNPLVVDYYPG